MHAPSSGCTPWFCSILTPTQEIDGGHEAHHMGQDGQDGAFSQMTMPNLAPAGKADSACFSNRTLREEVPACVTPLASRQKHPAGCSTCK